MDIHRKHDPHVVVADVDHFDRQSGSWVERAIFNHRAWIVSVCAIITVLLGFSVTHLRLNANYDGTIPIHDPFMVNYLNHYSKLQSKGNALRIVVAANSGKIDSAQYLATLQAVTHAVLDLPGVDRPITTSLWTPTTRWVGVNQYGLVGDAVIDEQYDGSPAAVSQVMQNILRAGLVGQMVSTDFRSSIIYAPLMNHDGETQGPINYRQLAVDLNRLRTQFANQGVSIHIVGFAMIVGDLILGIQKILSFFLISVIIAAAMLYWFTRSIRCTILVVACTLVAVTWQLGLLPLLGFSLDPYSVLVPFLIFAIGTSHGAQKMNGVMQDIGRGTHRLVAARYTFRRLFVAGFTALICDAVGFGVLGLIRIQEIQELAIIASCGVAILIFTNLILLPVLLSYFGVDKKAAERSLRDEETGSGLAVWDILAKCTRRPWAAGVIAISLGLAIIGFAVGRDVQIGNVSDGAPELRQNSAYNQDIRFIQDHYSVSDDSLVVLVDSQPYQCSTFEELSVLNRLGWRLQQLPEVQSVSSMSSFMQYMTQLMNDNSPKWNELVDSQQLLNDFEPQLPTGFASLDCSFVPLNVSLYNLKAKTLNKVVNVVQGFIADPKNQSPNFTLSLAGGNGGVAAATDRVIAQANAHMLLWIYAAVSILCYITFRSWLAVICAIVPLVVTSLLCQALMVMLGIGITVATLPVVALGVGIGVDYALYVLGVMMTHLRNGVSLEESYQRSLRFTGRVVMLTGLTLAVGVGTWVFAPIKFQADMGLLLAFMFLWNMMGALVLLPSLASFLLKPAKLP